MSVLIPNYSLNIKIMNMRTTLSVSGRAGVLAVALSAMALFGLVSIAYADVLMRQLDVGARGDDVSALQTYLAADPSIYPEGLVTGYFGSLTSAAVARFQAQNGIDPVGRVGPITLAALNLKMSGSSGVDTYAPIISNVRASTTANTAVIHWTTNEPARGIVYYSPSWITEKETADYDVDVSGSSAFTDTSLRTSQDVVLTGLAGRSTYYYVIYSADPSGNVQVTWPTTFMTN